MGASDQACGGGVFDLKEYISRHPRPPTLADEMIWDALSDEAKAGIASIIFYETMVWTREKLEQAVEEFHDFLVHNSEPG